MRLSKLNYAMTLLCAAILPTCVVSAQSMSDQETLSPKQSTELISRIFQHSLSVLDKAVVNVSQTSMACNGTYQVVLCTAKLPDQPIEYYAVMQSSDGKVVDGAMLGHTGDAMCLAIPSGKHGEVQYQPSPDVKVAMAGDTVQVIRTYNFFSTALGGNYFHKQGEVVCRYVARPEGKLERIAPVSTAVEKRGSANYLDENRPKDTYTNTTGEFYGLGMNAMRVGQMPLSEELDMTKLNALAVMMHEVIDRYGANAPENSETLSVVEFARWSTNMGLRNGSDYLTWIAQHPDEEKLTYFIQACVEESELDELAWLKQQVKTLKDKKARKWWEKWLKTMKND